MRLKPNEVDAIRTAAREAFGADAVVRLFGSRVDDSKRGGDIDLHIEAGPVDDVERSRDRFLDRLFCVIEPQKVDVVVSQRGAMPHGFERIAYRDGIVL